MAEPTPGMLETIQDDIITELEEIEGIKTVGAWQGDVEALLKMPQKMPSLHVIYQGAKFEPFDQVGSPSISSMDFLIVLVAQNLKSRKEGSVDSYKIIEAVRDKLIGHQVADYDFLRPIQEDLLMAEGSILAYGLTYGMKNILIMTE
ncbi:MAG: hypothetical protein WC637_00525 [Victivallales bacterium]|jgi:hypothetical protein